MRFILLILLFVPYLICAQSIDTIKEKTFKYVYFRISPISIYSGSGYMKDKILQNFEVGRTFGMIDVGFAMGQNSLRKDSIGNGNKFIESKITMVVCQYGIFSSEMTVGVGYVFNSQNYLMLELSYTIYGQFWKNLGIGITTGYVDFSGNFTDSSHNVFGLYLRYGLLRPENGGILNINRMHHRFHR